MKMEFSVGMGRDETLGQIAENTRVAEECGFSHVTYVDQQNLSRDVYAMMTVAALNTRRIRIGHGVTVPFTRHPSVTANATATIDELCGGRAFLGIGAGGNALRSMDMKARPMQEFREIVEFFKKYTSGEEAEYKGAKMHSEWVRRPIPVYMAATGPASCRLAGELADGVIIGPGVHPEVVKWRMEHIEKGAAKAGRDPSKIDIWVRTMVCVAESKEAARRAASAYGIRGPHALLSLDTPEVAELKKRLRRSMPDLQQLMEESKKVYYAYDEYHHEKLDSPHSKLVTQRMIDFIHLTGRPEDICERIYELGKIGVKNISTVLFTIQDKRGMMREIGDRVMPRFRN